MERGMKFEEVTQCSQVSEGKSEGARGPRGGEATTRRRGCDSKKLHSVVGLVRVQAGQDVEWPLDGEGDAI